MLFLSFFLGTPTKNQQKTTTGDPLPSGKSFQNFHRSAELLRPEAALDESSWSSFLGFEESNFSISESFFFFILDTSNTSRFWFSNLIDFDFEAVFCEKSLSFQGRMDIFPFIAMGFLQVNFDWGAASQLLEDEYRNELRRSGHPRWRWMEVFTGKLPPVCLPFLP